MYKVFIVYLRIY